MPGDDKLLNAVANVTALKEEISAKTRIFFIY